MSQREQNLLEVCKFFLDRMQVCKDAGSLSRPFFVDGVTHREFLKVVALAEGGK